MPGVYDGMAANGQIPAEKAGFLKIFLHPARNHALL